MALMEEFYKSVLEQDEAAVVLCDLNHIIVYMNPAAAGRYAKSGGYELVGNAWFLQAIHGLHQKLLQRY